MRTLEGLDAWVHLRQTKTGAYFALVSRGAMHRALPQRGLMASSPEVAPSTSESLSSLKYFRGYSHPKSEGPFHDSRTRDGVAPEVAAVVAGEPRVDVARGFGSGRCPPCVRWESAGAQLCKSCGVCARPAGGAAVGG